MTQLFCRCRRVFVTGAASFALWAAPAKAISVATSGAMSMPPALGPVFNGGDGTVGIFALGFYNNACNKIRNKYMYSTCVSTAAGVASATYNSSSGTAAGNSTKGIFSLGSTSGVPSSTRDKYTYATCTSALSSGASCYLSAEGSAAGNATRGIFAIGLFCCTTYCVCCCQCVTNQYTQNIREKYTYATDTNSSAAYASDYSRDGAAAGNCSRGIFALGLIYCAGASNPTTARNTYTYSTDTNASATASSANGGYGAAAGNSTRGIFALGYNGTSAATSRNKYTYATDTNAAAAAGSVATILGAAAGNSTRGIFQIGSTTGSTANASATRNKYLYACDTSTASGVGAASGTSFGGSGVSFSSGVNS